LQAVAVRVVVHLLQVEEAVVEVIDILLLKQFHQESLIQLQLVLVVLLAAIQ
jgi:hypothetical protein